jgi:hypothetical protein
MVKHQGPRFAEPSRLKTDEFKRESPYSWFVFGLSTIAIVVVFAVSLLIPT